MSEEIDVGDTVQITTVYLNCRCGKQEIAHYISATGVMISCAYQCDCADRPTLPGTLSAPSDRREGE